MPVDPTSISPFLLLFEALMLLSAGLCLRDALREGLGGGLHRVALLVAGVGFGLLLEWATIQQLQAYEYGRFAIMIAGEVPLGIGVGWGVILYASQRFSDATNLPGWLRPALDALLALNIDIAMDAVAIRLDMWDWSIGLGEDWFGVPWENFWAWFWVVLCFSAGARLAARLPGLWGRWLPPVSGVFLGVVGVVATNWFITEAVPEVVVPFVSGVPMAIALGLVLWQRPRLLREPGLAAIAVPMLFHAYFLVSGLVTGILLESRVLLIASVLMAALAMWLHRKPTPD